MGTGPWNEATGKGRSLHCRTVRNVLVGGEGGTDTIKCFAAKQFEAKRR